MKKNDFYYKSVILIYRLILSFTFFAFTLSGQTTISFSEVSTGSIATNAYTGQGIASIENGFHFYDTGITPNDDVLQPDVSSQPIVITFSSVQSQVQVTLKKHTNTSTLTTYNLSDAQIESIPMNTSSPTIYTTTLGGIKKIILSVNGTSFNDYDDLTFDYPVPVELTDFMAASNGSAVNLKWNTATEVNNYGFEVERRDPSVSLSASWKTLGFVKGAGNSNTAKSYSFTDKNLKQDTYSYRLKQIDIDGSFKYSKVVEVKLDKPKEFALAQNYPNPFNPTTTIKYSIPNEASVKLVIFNILGQEVATLVNKQQPAGQYEVKFDGNSAGSGLASGIYIYKLYATGNGENFESVKKLTLLK